MAQVDSSKLRETHNCRNGKKNFAQSSQCFIIHVRVHYARHIDFTSTCVYRGKDDGFCSWNDYSKMYEDYKKGAILYNVVTEVKGIRKSPVGECMLCVHVAYM